jgi:hypothetical protein
VFAGVDIAEKRGSAWCLLDGDYRSVAAGWVDHTTDPYRTAVSLRQAIEAAGPSARTPIGIDGPRMPLPSRRNWRWTKKGWSYCRDGIFGRHSEIVVRALKLANPQWTPTRDTAPAWMRLGFALFETLNPDFETLEVFPSASYRMLDTANTPRVTFDLRSFTRGPKDMLDAYVAALTIGEFKSGRGCEVGGGDGLGTIVLPRPVPIRDYPALGVWPGAIGTAGVAQPLAGR